MSIFLQCGIIENKKRCECRGLFYDKSHPDIFLCVRHSLDYYKTRKKVGDQPSFSWNYKLYKLCQVFDPNINSDYFKPSSNNGLKYSEKDLKSFEKDWKLLEKFYNENIDFDSTSKDFEIN